MSYSLVSMSEIKSWVRTREDYSLNDELYKSLGIQATKLIENVCRRQFLKQARTEYYDTSPVGTAVFDLYGGSESGVGYVSGAFQLSLPSIAIDPTEDFSIRFDRQRAFGDDTELTADTYMVDFDKATVSLFGLFPRTYKSLKITYTAGYEASEEDNSGLLSTPDAPQDLKLACLMTISFLFDKTKRQVGKVQKGSTDDNADYAQRGPLPSEALPILNQYKRNFYKR